MRVLGERLNGIQEVKSSILSVSTKKSRSSERDFFIHCESNGISPRVSVYIINTGVAGVASHQPSGCINNAFAMMIYKTLF